MIVRIEQLRFVGVWSDGSWILARIFHVLKPEILRLKKAFNCVINSGPLNRIWHYGLLHAVTLVWRLVYILVHTDIQFINLVRAWSFSPKSLLYKLRTFVLATVFVKSAFTATLKWSVRRGVILNFVEKFAFGLICTIENLIFQVFKIVFLLNQVVIWALLFLSFFNIVVFINLDVGRFLLQSVCYGLLEVFLDLSLVDVYSLLIEHGWLELFLFNTHPHREDERTAQIFTPRFDYELATITFNELFADH